MYGSVHQPAFRIGFWIMFLRANRPRLPICIQLAEIISYETTAREDTKQPLSRYCISRIQQLEIREVRNNKIRRLLTSLFRAVFQGVDISSQKSREDRYSKLKWFSRSATRRSKELTCTPDSRYNGRPRIILWYLNSHILFFRTIITPTFVFCFNHCVAVWGKRR